MRVGVGGSSYPQEHGPWVNHYDGCSLNGLATFLLIEARSPVFGPPALVTVKLSTGGADDIELRLPISDADVVC